MNNLEIPFDAWQTYFDEEKYKIQKLDENGVLGHHVDSLARLFSILKTLGLTKDEVSFFEIGTGNHVGQFYVDQDLKKPFSGLYTSNVANFFLLNQETFNYYGIDPNLDDERIEKFPNLFLPYINQIRQKVENAIRDGKLPVVFSNLVIGYYGRKFDGEEKKSITGFGSNPNFWDIPALQIHQYLLRDLVSREADLNLHVDSDKITDLTAPLLLLEKEVYSNTVGKLIQNAYDLNVPVISGRIDVEERCNSISVWSNL